MTTFMAARTSQSRVFIAEGLPGPNNPPVFQGCLVMGGASQSIGDVTSILCPDPENYDRFIKVGEIVAAEENVETSISGHFPLTSLSNIVRWGRAKTPLAIHVHFGDATNPQNFNVFEKAVIFDDGARITSTDIEDMGSLDSSDAIGQSADISAADYYEVVPLNYITRVDNLVTAATVGGAIDKLYDQTLPLGNRYAFYVVQDALLIYSVDGGENWATMAVTAGASGVGVINEVPVIINDTTGDTYYADVLNGATSVTTVTGTENLNCIFSIGNEAYVGGNTGFFGVIEDYTSAPVQMTLGTAANIVSVHALPGGVILAGTSDGYVFFSTDGTNFGSFEVEAVQAITAVCAVDDSVFWAGTDTGNLYYSVDAGQTWSLRGFPGSGSGAVTGIVFPTLSVGWVAHQPSGAVGRLIKTVGAGAVGTWYQVPRAGALPTIYQPKLASVHGEPNILMATGQNLESTPTDGVAVLGIGS